MQQVIDLDIGNGQRWQGDIVELMRLDPSAIEATLLEHPALFAFFPSPFEC